VVEGARLESVYTGNRIKSSNLFFTATFKKPSLALGFFIFVWPACARQAPLASGFGRAGLRIAGAPEAGRVQGAAVSLLPVLRHLSPYQSDARGTGQFVWFVNTLNWQITVNIMNCDSGWRQRSAAEVPGVRCIC
jgi:hypothetical protein